MKFQCSAFLFTWSRNRFFVVVVEFSDCGGGGMTTTATRDTLRRALDAVLLPELVGVIEKYVVVPPLRGRWIGTWTIPDAQPFEVDYVRVATDGVHVVVARSKSPGRGDQTLDMYDLQGNKVASKLRREDKDSSYYYDCCNFDTPYEGVSVYRNDTTMVTIRSEFEAWKTLHFSRICAIDIHPGDGSLFVAHAIENHTDTQTLIQQFTLCKQVPPCGHCVRVFDKDIMISRQMIFMPNGNLLMVHQNLPLFKVYE